MSITSAALDHLNLTVTRFEESAAWYQKLFGFRVVERGMEEEGPWGILRSGDSMLCIYESPKHQIVRWSILIRLRGT